MNLGVSCFVKYPLTKNTYFTFNNYILNGIRKKISSKIRCNLYKPIKLTKKIAESNLESFKLMK